jgi:hypothetical protein
MTHNEVTPAEAATAADTLRAARALIDKPEKWTHGYGALNANGRLTGSLSPDAVCWDVEGAIMRSTPLDAPPPACDPHPAFRLLSEAVGHQFSALGWGEEPGRTHDEVLAAFDRAIQLAEARVEA